MTIAGTPEKSGDTTHDSLLTSPGHGRPHPAQRQQNKKNQESLLASGLDLREVQVGIYGTRSDLHWYLEEIRELLDETKQHGSPGMAYELHYLESDAPGSPEVPEENQTSIAEMYEELPEQWRDEHPGETPDNRSVFEVRVGILSTWEEYDYLNERLPLLICPEPFHKGPCRMPWSVASCSSSVSPELRVYLEARYAHLRD
ncbi:hypothetical protein GCM10009799_13160 [Nocardiopsis rhodophaea]|uniref:Uncharacterized protein n=1 Tax=Nocardiopsis rhodophaea TaxID=280238 RepID=A0ABN2SMV1_9ACTN